MTRLGERRPGGFMRIGDTDALSKPRPRTPVAERDLDAILRIPHTAAIRARLAAHTVGRNGEGAAEAAALVQACDDAVERDQLAALRPDGCWCFGRGGTGERAVLVPGDEVPMVLSVYCRCPEGIDRRRHDDELRVVSRAYDEQARLSSVWAAVRVPERFNGCTLETFPATTERMRQVVARLPGWLDSEQWALVLHGGFGIGKTGLGIGLLRLAAERRTVGLFVKAPDLLSRMRATYGKNSDMTELEVLDSLRTVPLLMLDDVGADRATDWATALLFQVLDARHDAALKTIVTTNLDPPDLALHLGERTMHRFDEGAVLLHIDGPNLRKDRKGV